MTGAGVVIELLGGVALLLWATRMVRRAIERAAGVRIRAIIRHSVQSRIRASAMGAVSAAFLQSSAATGLLVASFAERGLIALAPALAMMLGADLGSSLAVQILSLKSDWVISLLLIVGVMIATGLQNFSRRQIGRALLGVGLILLSLDIIVGATDVIRDAPSFAHFINAMAAAPILAFIAGAVIAWGSHSSLASVLLIASLAGVGIFPFELALALVLGANVGSGLIPLAAAAKMGGAARRVLLGNLGFRLIGALAGLVLLRFLAQPLSAMIAPGAGVILAHIVFNLSLALCFLPFIHLAARGLERFVPAAPDRPARLSGRLKGVSLKRSDLAIATVNREVLRLADIVELMLEEVPRLLKADNNAAHIVINKLENDVDALQGELKRLLANLMGASQKEDISRQYLNALMFATNLEHAADIIDNGLLKLAIKRQRLGAAFSEEGAREIDGLQTQAIQHLRLAVSVYSTGDLDLAKELVAKKDKFRKRERKAVANHIRRLQAGTAASLETSDIHLDVVRDLKHIIAHLTAVAHPILEAHGALRGTRLIAE